MSDNAMISVYPFGDELYAFTEFPVIHRFDIKTLDTVERVSDKTVSHAKQRQSRPLEVFVRIFFRLLWVLRVLNRQAVEKPIKMAITGLAMKMMHVLVSAAVFEDVFCIIEF